MMAGLPLLLAALLAIVAIGVDAVLGEPRRLHPLVGFGRLANRIEHLCHPASTTPAQASASPQTAQQTGPGTWSDTGPDTGSDIRPSPGRVRMAGVLAWCCAVLPITGATVWILSLLPFALACIAHLALLWFAIGAKSLRDHIAPIGKALAQGQLGAARTAAARVVSRDLQDADETAVARAAIESALENGSDAVIAPLFWFLIGGGPAAVCYRLINTLDAMWGYRTPRYRDFGWAAARIDDVANWIPARLTACAYMTLGDASGARACWRSQAPAWESPNAGPVMAAGAGSLGVQLGGPARYHGQMEDRPPLGRGRSPTAADVPRALRLLQRSIWLLLALAVGAGAVLALL